MNLIRITLIALIALLTSCASKPPSDVNNICSIFRQHPSWYRDAKDVQKRWLVPIPVQMAIIHQESKFDAKAKPKGQTILWVIPWKRPSTASGYAQALRMTWARYKKSNGNMFSSRSDFGDAVDFIGWYADEAYRQAGIPRTDTYSLYLAYHEGVGGYKRKTYLKKPWLVQVARKVKARAYIYEAQMQQCRPHWK